MTDRVPVPQWWPATWSGLCCVPVGRCEIHHIDNWLHHRRTDLARLLPLCVKHHHLIDDGGWRLTMTADRTVTVHRPDGTRCYTGTTTDRQPTIRND